MVVGEVVGAFELHDDGVVDHQVSVILADELAFVDDVVGDFAGDGEAADAEFEGKGSGVDSFQEAGAEGVGDFEDCAEDGFGEGSVVVGTHLSFSGNKSQDFSAADGRR